MGHLTFLRAPEKRIFFFFLFGNPVQNCPQNPTLGGSYCLLERVDLRSQKEGLLWRKIAWGRVGRTGQKKGQKDAQKKVGHSSTSNISE